MSDPSAQECADAPSIFGRIDEVKIASIRDGDVIVLRTENHIPSETQERMLRLFRDRVVAATGRKNVTVTMLHGGIDLAILRPEDAA